MHPKPTDKQMLFDDEDPRVPLEVQQYSKHYNIKLHQRRTIIILF